MFLSKLLLLFLLFQQAQPPQPLPEEPKPNITTPAQPAFVMPKEFQGKTPAELWAMQKSADAYLLRYYNGLGLLRENHKQVSEELVQRLSGEIVKCYNEKITDPTYRDDWNKFAADVEEVEMYVSEGKVKKHTIAW